MGTWLACAGAAALLFAASVGSASTSSGGQAARLSGPVRTAEVRDRQQDLQQIQRIIESREKDPRMLQKMREKVGHLTDAQMRLAVRLCSRIDTGDRSVAADLAFSLVTALIILS